MITSVFSQGVSGETTRKLLHAIYLNLYVISSTFALKSLIFPVPRRSCYEHKQINCGQFSFILGKMVCFYTSSLKRRMCIGTRLFFSYVVQNWNF